MRKVHYLLGALCFLFVEGVYAEGDLSENVQTISSLQLDKANMFKPIVALEAWATYSSGESECVDRTDVNLRRFRFGASGQPYAFLKYSFMMHFDRIGEDGFASTKGSYNGVGLWNAYATVKVLKNSELLNLHVGYFWAAVSREFMTSTWAVGSFDKSYSSYYLRHFVTGAGNGITSGIALGGVKNFDHMGLSYRIGTYEPGAYLSADCSSRLYTGRVMWSIGEPEATSYKYMTGGNRWSKRKGVTLALGGSTQSDGALSETLDFDHSWTYGADVLWDYGPLSITGEYYVMGRESEGYEAFEAITYNVRAGCNFNFKSTFIEPNVSFNHYQSSGDAELYKFIGDDSTLDLGVNWYLNKDKLKLSLHYVMQDGSAASNTGDYIGAGFQFRL